MESLRHAGGNSRRNQRLTPLPAGIVAQARRSIRSKWGAESALAGVVANVLAPRMADGASAVTELPRALPHHRNPNGPTHDSGNKRQGTQRENSKKPSSRIRSFPTIDITPRIAVNSRIRSPPSTKTPTDGTTTWHDSTHHRRGTQISLRKVVVRATKKREETTPSTILPPSILHAPTPNRYPLI